LWWCTWAAEPRRAERGSLSALSSPRWKPSLVRMSLTPLSRQELLTAACAARYCIPNGQIEHIDHVGDGAGVKRRLWAAVQAAAAALRTAAPRRDGKGGGGFVASFSEASHRRSAGPLCLTPRRPVSKSAHPRPKAPVHGPLRPQRLSMPAKRGWPWPQPGIAISRPVPTRR
jgi:hypothetical protein